jgi:hypothetical protein
MRTLLAALTLVALVSCKKDEAAKPTTGQPAMPAAPGPAAMPAPPAMPAPSPGAPAAPQVDPKNPLAALQQLGQQLGQAFGAKGGQGTVVNWRSLEPFVPAKIGDWAADGEVRGSTGGLGGLQASTVSRRYTSGERRLRVKIVDTTASPFMRAGFAFAQGMNQDSSEGIKKGIQVSGNTGILEWSKGSNRSKVAVLVADRFLVDVSVSPAANAEEASAIAGQLNLSGLAAVK